MPRCQLDFMCSPFVVNAHLIGSYIL